MPSRSRSQRHHHHSRHHSNNFPPQEYADLSNRDIELLAPVLTPLPPPGTSAAASYDSIIKQQIADLPSHLQAKHPKLSTFCKLHEKLNPLPVVDFLAAVKHEVSPWALGKWAGVKDVPATLLRDANAIWMKPEVFAREFGRAATTTTRFHEHKCAACKLCIFAQSGAAVAAVGSLVMGKMDPRHWRRSRRILWFETWLKVLSAVDGRWGKRLVEEMWERGVELRGVREGERGGREWVEGYVAQAKARGRKVKGSSGVESLRVDADASARDDEDVYDSFNAAAAAAPPQDPFATPTASSPVVNPFADPDNEQVMDALFAENITSWSAMPQSLHPREAPSAYDDERSRLVRTPTSTINASVRAPSSVYSRRVDEDMSEEEVIEAYRGGGAGARVSGRRFV